jgi:hypothetical protein
MRLEVVNGYVCRNCSDVDLAKRGVDPAHPKDGPNGAYKAETTPADRGPAVRLDGALAEAAAASPSTRIQPAPYVPGALADLKA